MFHGVIQKITLAQFFLRHGDSPYTTPHYTVIRALWIMRLFFAKFFAVADLGYCNGGLTSASPRSRLLSFHFTSLHFPFTLSIPTHQSPLAHPLSRVFCPGERCENSKKQTERHQFTRFVNFYPQWYLNLPTTSAYIIATGLTAVPHYLYLT